MVAKKRQPKIDALERGRKSSASVRTDLKVFISHDARDTELAKAFADLISGASAGILKSFWSSDKSGTHGLPYGSDWYQTLMSKLIEASDVVCLLTPFSAERPWILFEAGVAKGRLDTPVYGVALGIPLSRASIGPFAQFQNCGDDIESLTSLVIQLVRRIRGADPSHDVVEGQVRGFKDRITKVLQDPARAIESTREEINPGEKVVKMFEEIKTGVAGLRDKGEPSTPYRELSPALFEQIMYRTNAERKRAHGFLIIVSLLQDEFPWLYELGLDVWRAAGDQAYREAMQLFHVGLDLTLNLPMVAKQGKSLGALHWLKGNLKF